MYNRDAINRLVAYIQHWVLWNIILFEYTPNRN